MTAYRALFALGVLLLAGALFLAVRSARFYFAYDIRGVRDDLSGRSRRRGIDEMRPAQVSGRGRPARVALTPDDTPTQVIYEDDNVGTQVYVATPMEGTGNQAAFEVVERLVLLGGKDCEGIEGEA